MKILISVPRFLPHTTYGAEIYFTHMLQGLLRVKETSDEITVAANAKAAHWMTETFTSAHMFGEGINVVAMPVPHNTVSGLAYEQWALPRLVRSYGADVTFFPFNFMPTMGIAPTKQGNGSVLMVHDLVSHFYRAHFPRYRPAFNYIQASILRRSIIRAGAIITPSQAMADDLLKAYPEVLGKVTVIREAVPCFPNGHSEAELPEVWQQTPHLLMQSGAKLPHKSQNTSLEALAILKRVAPKLYDDIRLVITGGSPSEQEELATAVAEHGIEDVVDLAGRVPRATLGALAARANLHLFPTLYEGFGLGIVESLALGKNFVASDLPVLREVSEGQGIFFEPGNAVAMAQALKKALTSRLAPTIPPNWDWDDHGRALLTIIRSAAGM